MSPADDIRVATVAAAEVPLVARIFVDAFPARVEALFARRNQALGFYGDLFELMRRAHGDDFLVARDGQRCLGFLVLVRPEARLLPSLLRDGFFLRTAANGLRTGYLLSTRMITSSLASLRRGGRHEEAVLARLPHVYAVAVEAEATGGGVGRLLLEAARARCGAAYAALGLAVESDNLRAIAFYERLGFEHAGRGEDELHMVWRFDRSAASGAGASS